MESRWPEHTPEPDEPPPWRGWAIGAGVIVAIALLVPSDNNWFGAWQAPDISMPQISLPQAPDLNLRGRTDNAQPEPQSPATASVSEGIVAPSETPNGQPVVRHVPFDACIGTIEQSIGAFGPPAWIENTPDRRVARFKVVEGSLTVTCSRTDGTMTIEQNT